MSGLSPFEDSQPMRRQRLYCWVDPQQLSRPMAAPAWLSGFTICLRDGVTNGNKCVSFMGNMWESSCPRLGDSAGVDSPGMPEYAL